MISEEKGKLRVIVCRPDKIAETVEIDDDLHAMQDLVGGLIQEFMPFHSEDDSRYDDVAIICNEEGKLMRMKPNRAIFDEDGQMQDIIAGPFFICYAPLERESFLPMPHDLEEVFLRKFEMPEYYFQTEKGIMATKYDPGKKNEEVTIER